MAKVQVRLSIRPDELTEVDEDELPVLRAQGLLLEDGPPSAEPASLAAPASPDGTDINPPPGE